MEGARPCTTAGADGVMHQVDLDGLQRKNASLQRDLEAAERHGRELESEVGFLQTKVKELQLERVANLAKMLDDSGTDQNYNGLLKETLEEAETLRTEAETLRKWGGEQGRELERKKQEGEHLKRRIDTLEAANASLEDRLQSAEEKMSGELQKTAEEFSGREAALQHEVEVAKLSAATVSSQIQTLETEMLRFRAVELAERDRNAQEAGTEVKNLKEEVKRLKQREAKKGREHARELAETVKRLQALYGLRDPKNYLEGAKKKGEAARHLNSEIATAIATVKKQSLSATQNLEKKVGDRKHPSSKAPATKNAEQPRPASAPSLKSPENYRNKSKQKDRSRQSPPAAKNLVAGLVPTTGAESSRRSASMHARVRIGSRAGVPPLVGCSVGRASSGGKPARAGNHSCKSAGASPTAPSVGATDRKKKNVANGATTSKGGQRGSPTRPGAQPEDRQLAVATRAADRVAPQQLERDASGPQFQHHHGGFSEVSSVKSDSVKSDSVKSDTTSSQSKLSDSSLKSDEISSKSQSSVESGSVATTACTPGPVGAVMKVKFSPEPRISEPRISEPQISSPASNETAPTPSAAEVVVSYAEEEPPPAQVIVDDEVLASQPDGASPEDRPESASFFLAHFGSGTDAAEGKTSGERADQGEQLSAATESSVTPPPQLPSATTATSSTKDHLSMSAGTTTSTANASLKQHYPSPQAVRAKHSPELLRKRDISGSPISGSPHATPKRKLARSTNSSITRADRSSTLVAHTASSSTSTSSSTTKKKSPANKRSEPPYSDDDEARFSADQSVELSKPQQQLLRGILKRDVSSPNLHADMPMGRAKTTKRSRALDIDAVSEMMSAHNIHLMHPRTSRSNGPTARRGHTSATSSRGHRPAATGQASKCAGATRASKSKSPTDPPSNNAENASPSTYNSTEETSSSAEGSSQSSSKPRPAASTAVASDRRSISTHATTEPQRSLSRTSGTARMGKGLGMQANSASPSGAGDWKVRKALSTIEDLRTNLEKVTSQYDRERERGDKLKKRIQAMGRKAEKCIAGAAAACGNVGGN